MNRFPRSPISTLALVSGTVFTPTVIGQEREGGPATIVRNLYTVGETKNFRLKAPTDSPLTVLEAITQAVPGKRADLSNVVLLRPSLAGTKPPKKDNTTLLWIDVRKMIMTGNTRFNVMLQANDLLYAPKKRWLGKSKPTRFDVLSAALAGKPDPALTKLVWFAAKAATHNSSVKVRVQSHIFFLRHHKSPPTRQTHVVALGSIKKDIEVAVTAMRRLLPGRGPETPGILVALGMLGPSAKSALPAVLALERAPDEKTRRLATATAKRIRGN